jgi:hypothetical protein
VAAASSTAAISAADLARSSLAADEAREVGEGARESQSSLAGGVWIALAPGERAGSGAPDRDRSGDGFTVGTLSHGDGCTAPPGAFAGRKPRRT